MRQGLEKSILLHLDIHVIYVEWKNNKEIMSINPSCCLKKFDQTGAGGPVFNNSGQTSHVNKTAHQLFLLS